MEPDEDLSFIEEEKAVRLRRWNHARFADFERGRGIKTLRGKERGDPQKS
jgi:hypothetical protein